MESFTILDYDALHTETKCFHSPSIILPKNWTVYEGVK
jgi:hypothetical protein